MDTQEILSKIAKLKRALESETDADVKASYNKKISALEAQVADAEAKVEKKEEKAAAEEKKTLSDADEKIKKLEKALASESDPDVKARYQKKLNELKGTLKDVKEEIKEEKKEIAEQKKEIKQAVKEVKSVQKEVRKTAIKKVAAKKVERKKVETKKTKRKEKLNRVLSDLDALIEKNKKLKSKYGSGYKGTGKPTDLERDAGRKAKPFGYRFVGKHDYRVPTEMQIKRGLKRGTIDYEARPNRADVNPSKKVKLADGGMMSDGGDGKRVEVINTVISMLKSIDVDAKTLELIIGKLGMEEQMLRQLVMNNPQSDIKDLLNEKIELDNQMLDSGMMRRGGRTKAAIVADKRYKALKAGKRVSEDGNVYYESRANRSDVSRRDKLEDGGMMDDGGMMKRGGKVGTSKEDRARYAKPAGWRWKDEAVTKRIIERKQLSMQPSKKMREKYPDLVYYEDRLNKADKKPTRTSADSI
jgi:myosin heavy subunit